MQFPRTENPFSTLNLYAIHYQLVNEWSRILGIHNAICVHCACLLLTTTVRVAVAEMDEDAPNA